MIDWFLRKNRARLRAASTHREVGGITQAVVRKDQKGKSRWRLAERYSPDVALSLRILHRSFGRREAVTGAEAETGRPAGKPCKTRETNDGGRRRLFSMRNFVRKLTTVNSAGGARY
jgi:hypothetical protein